MQTAVHVIKGDKRTQKSAKMIDNIFKPIQHLYRHTGTQTFHTQATHAERTIQHAFYRRHHTICSYLQPDSSRIKCLLRMCNRIRKGMECSEMRYL